MSETLEQLIDAIGARGVASLRRVWGGRPLHIGPVPTAVMIELLGAEGAARLALKFEGETLVLPRYSAELKRAEMLRLRSEGGKISEIAEALDITQRRVLQVLAEERVTTNVKSFI